MSRSEMNFRYRIATRYPARKPSEQFHIVSRHDTLGPGLSNDLFDAPIGVEQIPGIALVVAGRPHAFKVRERDNGVAGDDVRSCRRRNLDPLRAKGVPRPLRLGRWE